MLSFLSAGHLKQSQSYKSLLSQFVRSRFSPSAVLTPRFPTELHYNLILPNASGFLILYWEWIQKLQADLNALTRTG